MRLCLDEGMLQSYFDGELSTEAMERATSHLASCAVCAAAVSELEQESLLLSTALAAEFATSVLLLKAGEMISTGKPDQVMTETLLRRVFETGLIVDKNPISGAPRMTLVPTNGSGRRVHGSEFQVPSS